MRCMFKDCGSLTSIDLSNFDTIKVTDVGYMFDGCSNLTKIIYGSNFVYNGATVYGMFNECSANKPTHESWTGITF